MSNSVQKQFGGPAWALGYVNVPTPGTPVCIMTNVDPTLSGAPGVVVNQQYPGLEYSPTFKGIALQPIKPGNNNVAMVANTGNVYLLVAPSGNNSGNKSDTGAMIKAIGPGIDFFYPPPNPGMDRFSGYSLYLDADVANEGALIVGYGAGN